MWYDEEGGHSFTKWGQNGDWKIQEKPVQPKLEAKLKYILILNMNICSPWLPSTHHTTFLATRSIYLSQY